MERLREMMFRDLNGEGLNLAGPQWGDPLPYGGQRKAADAVKQASERNHFVAAWTIVRVVLTAAWAV